MLPKDSTFQKRYEKLMRKKKKLNRQEFCHKNFKRMLMMYTVRIKWLSKLLKSTKYEITDITNQSNYFATDRIAVYTAIFGGYDNLNEPECFPDNCDFYIITDQNVRKDSAWKPIHLNLRDYELERKDNIVKNRFCKMFPDKLFTDYKYSIYVDGNFKILTDLTEFIHGMGKYGIKMHNHYRRNCVYKEIDKCLALGKDTIANLTAHKEHLVNEGMPREYGLLEAPIIVREHHNPLCRKLMNEWWHEFLQYSRRDQISFPYVLWKNNIKTSEIALLGNDIYSNYAFKRVNHNKLDQHLNT